MKTETIGWVATAIGTPIVVVALCWTLVIFNYHRLYWRSTDLLLAAILSQGVIKQLATFAYTILTLLQTLDSSEAWCSFVVWLLTSIHMLQAGTLATLIFSRLLAVRSPVKYRQTVKRTHLVYHLVSLSILSACIGVAAVLAEEKLTYRNEMNISVNASHCTFLPHEMDSRYAILSLTLHSLFTIASLIALIMTLFSRCCLYRYNKSNISVSEPSTIGKQKRQLLTSSPDLSAMSDLSLTSIVRNDSSVTQNTGSDRDVKCPASESSYMGSYIASNLRYIQPTVPFSPQTPKITTSFDALPTVAFSGVGKCAGDVRNNCKTQSEFLANFTYAAPKSLSSYDGTYDRNYIAAVGDTNEAVCRWTSESSYISTSTSSTNSRAPCLARQQAEANVVEPEELRLASVIPVFVLCYAVNHLPVMGLTAMGMFTPWLLPEVWSLPALVLWAGLAEECLLPILLVVCDRNFTTWIANIYTCRDKRVADLARHHEGLNGKFRVFNSQSELPVPTQHNVQHVQQEPIKFPITNGSLFTSVDGRVPIIHNYRRGKGVRTCGTVNMGLPGVQTKRNEILQTFITLENAAIENQERNISTDDSHNFSQNFTDQKTEFEAYLPSGMDTTHNKSLNQKTRLHNGDGNKKLLSTDFGIGNIEHHLSEDDLDEYNVVLNDDGDDEDDDDDDEPIYATLSSRSCCSATTAANDDFEFFQNEGKLSKLLSSLDVELGEECSLSLNTQSDGESNTQSLLPKHQREMLLNEEDDQQAYQCVDWTLEQDNEVMRMVLPLIKACKNEKDHSKSSYNKVTHNENKILKTVIQNELKNKQKAEQGSGRRSCGFENPYKEDDYLPNHIESKSDISPGCSCESLNLRLPQVTNATSKVNKNANMLTGSLSLNNLDDLLLKEEENLVLHRRSSRSSANEERIVPQHEQNSSDEREVVFELPVKSESVLSLYRLDFDGESGKPPENVGVKEANNHRFYKQIPPNRRNIGQPTPLTHRLGQQTPLTRRHNRQKKLPVPVLSVESLTTALNSASVSYLDNGDLCRHGSVPDLKRVFVSDYI